MIYKLCRAGTYHDCDEEKNQDVVLVEMKGNYVVITLADGVSTCEEAGNGARIAAEAVTNLLLKKGDYFLKCESEKRKELILSHIIYELEQKAAESGKKIAEYSSTITSILVDNKSGKLLFFNLGDSMILTVQDGKCQLIAKPADSREGCPVTTTKGAVKVIETEVVNTRICDSILVCSDGAWRKLFCGGCLRKEAEQMILKKEYHLMEQFLEQQECRDDYSFVSIDMAKARRHKAA